MRALALTLAWVLLLDLAGATTGSAHAIALAILAVLFTRHPHRDAAASFAFIATGLAILRTTLAIDAHTLLEPLLAASSVMFLAILDTPHPTNRSPA